MRQSLVGGSEVAVVRAVGHHHLETSIHGDVCLFVSIFFMCQ